MALPPEDAYIGDLLSAWSVVTGMDTSNVDSVFVAGKARKWAGQLVDADLKRLQVLALASREHLDRRRKVSLP